MPEFTLRTFANRFVGDRVVNYAPGDVLTIDDGAEIERLIKAGAIAAPDAPDPAPAPEPEAVPVPPTATEPIPAAGDPVRPPKAGSHAAWVDYAVAKGLNRDEAQDMSKADLIAAVGD
jgi:hypothetical protein